MILQLQLIVKILLCFERQVTQVVDVTEQTDLVHLPVVFVLACVLNQAFLKLRIRPDELAQMLLIQCTQGAPVFASNGCSPARLIDECNLTKDHTWL